MMDMVPLFAWDFFHRPSAGHLRAARSDYRPVINMGRAGHSIFGKELAIDLDADAIFESFDVHGSKGRRGCAERRHKEETCGNHKMELRDKATAGSTDEQLTMPVAASLPIYGATTFLFVSPSKHPQPSAPYVRFLPSLVEAP